MDISNQICIHLLPSYKYFQKMMIIFHILFNLYWTQKNIILLLSVTHVLESHVISEQKVLQFLTWALKGKRINNFFGVAYNINTHQFTGITIFCT